MLKRRPWEIATRTVTNFARLSKSSTRTRHGAPTATGVRTHLLVDHLFSPLPPGEARHSPSESETVIDNDLYRITFTNRGAQVKSWILKKFDNDEQNGPLDLVHPIAAQKYGYPLSLWTYDDSLRSKLNSVLYLPSHQGMQTAPADITFEYSDQDLSVRKTFHFDHTYVLKLETAVTYKGSPVVALPAWPSGFGDQNTPASYAAALIAYQSDTNV